MLERTAKGLVDDKANAQNQQYIAALLDTAKDPNSEGARGGVQQYLSDANQALGMLAPYAGQTILTNGLPSISYGAAQTYFSATPEQRADPTVNTFLGIAAGPIAPGMALRDEARIERLAAINGSAQPVYPVEEALLGGAILNRAMATAASAIEGMDVLLAGRITPSSGGNISAQKITLEAVPAKLTSAEVSVLQKIASLPNTTLQGDAREYVSNSYFMRNGYTPLDGKCGSNCFDGIYTKNGQVFVAEVKPLNADGTIQLNGLSLRADGTELPTQMTDRWIAGSVNTLKESGDPIAMRTASIIQAAIDGGTLVKVVTGVNQNGMVLLKLK